jgi:hypothetical protein
MQVNVRNGSIVLQKSFCGIGLKFSEARARRLNNDVGDHVATRQTHRRFWQRVCGSIERRLSLVSFFGENLAAVAFGTFATLSVNNGKTQQEQMFSALRPTADIVSEAVRIRWVAAFHNRSLRESNLPPLFRADFIFDKSIRVRSETVT